MKTHRVLKGSVVAIIILVAAYIAFISIPYSVNKHYEGAIYNGQNQIIKKVPITLKGKVYRGLFSVNQFMGTVEIDGKTYTVTTGRVTHASPVRIAGRIQSMHSKYPYLALITALDGQGYTVTTGTIEMSGNFNKVYASTNAISKEYGKQAVCRAPIASG